MSNATDVLTDISSMEEAIAEANLYILGNNMMVVGGSTILLLGITCNTLALVVLQKRKVFNVGISTYLSALSICDNCFLVFSLLTWITYSGTGLFLGTLIECNVMFFLNYVPSHLTSYLHVAISFDRFVMLHRPVGFKRSPEARYVVLLLVILSVLTNWHFLGGLKGVNTHVINEACIGRNDFINAYHVAFSVWLDSVFYSFVPSLLIILVNTLVICKIHKHKAVVPIGMTTAAAQCRAVEIRRLRRDHVTRVTLLVTFAFVLFTTPICLLQLVDMGEDTYGPWKNATFYVIGIVLFLVMHINHCINLFIYCLFGKRFRSHLLKYVDCRKRRVYPITVAIIVVPPVESQV